MNPVIYVSTDISKAYEDDSFIGRIKDRLRIHVEGESFIEELKLTIAQVKLPPNFTQKAYISNMAVAQKFMKKRSAAFAPKTARYFDFKLLNDFQKKLFAYSVVNSIKLLLRIKQKTIKSACIVIYDAADDILQEISCELAKGCRYFILLSSDLKKVSKLGDYIIANYGISPIVTSDYNYALSKADFVISSKNIEVKKPIWYINNLFLPNNDTALAVNDVSFAVPWKIEDLEVSYEILGAILSQMQEKNIEASLKYNGIYLDKIKFNKEVKTY
jgi:hypothetical protein